MFRAAVATTHILAGTGTTRFQNLSLGQGAASDQMSIQANATVQRQLQDSIDTGSDAPERKRQCILVLPRGDEALEMPGFDEPIASRQQGYAIRRKEVEQALANANLPKTPVYFFDARNDDPDKIWKVLRDQVGDMRAVYAQRANDAAAGVINLRENVDYVRAAEARRDVEAEVGRILGTVTTLPLGVRPAHQNLIDQMAVGHHSSIAASIARRGEWPAFQFAHILGQGVRIDANQRTAQLVLKIEHKLEDLENKYSDLVAVVQSLQALRLRLSEHRQEFLSAARTIGRDAYGQLLGEQGDLWNTSARRYGLGSGYKRDVAEIWRDWFETEAEAHSTARTVGERLQDAWSHWVIEKLRQAMEAQADGKSLPIKAPSS